MILCIFGGEIVSDCLQIPEDFSIHIAFMTSPCAMHQHDYLELAYIRRGWTQHTLEGETRTLTAGDFILVDYGEVHSYDVVGQNLEAINCMFRPVSVDSGLRNCRSFRELLDSWLLGMGYIMGGIPGQEKVFRDETGQVQQLLTRLLTEFQYRKLGYAPMVRALLTEILVEMARLLGARHQSVTQHSIQWMLEEIRRNPGHPHQLSQYAKQLQTRPEMLCRLFQKEVGMGFQQYLRQVRMQLACGLLQTTQNSIPQIAEQCGYEDVKSFREAFRQERGCSPLQWKKQG